MTMLVNELTFSPKKVVSPPMCMLIASIAFLMVSWSKQLTLGKTPCRMSLDETEILSSVLIYKIMHRKIS